MSIVVICDAGHIKPFPNAACGTCAKQARLRQKPKKLITRTDMAYQAMVKHKMTLPANRLRALVTKGEARTAWMNQYRASQSTADKTMHRLWNASRISIDCADRWCIALGTHLALVYPEVYWIPVGRGHRPKQRQRVNA